MANDLAIQQASDEHREAFVGAFVAALSELVVEDSTASFTKPAGDTEP